MAVATTIPRYDKNQLLLIDGKEVRLIEHLHELRSSKKITKKKISNMIKNNDYWYSQVERNGKNGDDNRQRTIYKPDLIDIISIVKYDAEKASDLKAFHDKSEIYINKVIKAVPLKESIRKLEWYNIHNNRTPTEQERLFTSLLNSHTTLLRQAFNNLISIDDKDLFLNSLKNINTSLRIDPVFIILLSGLPYADFLYESKQEKLYAFLRNIMGILDSFIDNETSSPQDASFYFKKLEKEITNYTGKNIKDVLNKRTEPLPPDEPIF